MGQSKAQRTSKTLLTEDGELEEVAVDHDVAHHHGMAPVFCIHCGTANRAEATYCRSCGRAMEEQDVDSEITIGRPGGGAKEKRSNDKQAKKEAKALRPVPAATPLGAIIEFMTLVAVLAMSAITLSSGAPGLVIAVWIAWCIVVAARNGALD